MTRGVEGACPSLARSCALECETCRNLFGGSFVPFFLSVFLFFFFLNLLESLYLENGNSLPKQCQASFREEGGICSAKHTQTPARTHTIRTEDQRSNWVTRPFPPFSGLLSPPFYCVKACSLVTQLPL